VCARARACVRMCVCACVYVHVCVLSMTQLQAQGPKLSSHQQKLGSGCVTPRHGARRVAQQRALPNIALPNIGPPEAMSRGLVLHALPQCPTSCPTKTAHFMPARSQAEGLCRRTSCQCVTPLRLLSQSAEPHRRRQRNRGSHRSKAQAYLGRETRVSRE